MSSQDKRSYNTGLLSEEIEKASVTCNNAEALEEIQSLLKEQSTCVFSVKSAQS